MSHSSQSGKHPISGRQENLIRKAKVTLKLAKNSAKAKQPVEAELFTKMSQKTSAPVLMRLYD